MAGVLLGLAHLTKAAMLPFVAVFLAVLAPYLAHSKRAFGHYSYNVNSTFYIWYDDWRQASDGTYSHGDHVAWPDMPASELPSASRYWREHSLRQITSRVLGGFEDMVVRSYRTFWYLKYMTVFVVLAAWLAWQGRPDVARLVRANAGLFSFLVMYAVTFLLLIAFYAPTSGTGTTRFLLAHVAPAAFVLARFSALAPFDRASTTVGGAIVTTRHVHLLVSVLLGLDVVFTIWPRLMTTYGGF